VGRFDRHLADGLVVTGHGHQILDGYAVAVQQFDGPIAPTGRAGHQAILLGCLPGQRLVPDGVVGVDLGVVGQRLGRPGRGEGLDHVTVAAGVERQEAVGTGEVGVEDGVAGGRCRVAGEGITYHRRPHDAPAAVGGHQVVNTHAYAGLVHAQLA